MNAYSELRKQYVLKQITEEQFKKEKAACIESFTRYLNLYFDGKISKEDLISIINE